MRSRFVLAMGATLLFVSVPVVMAAPLGAQGTVSSSAASVVASCPPAGQTIPVTSAANFGDGTLREAIICANNYGGSTTISDGASTVEVSATSTNNSDSTSQGLSGGAVSVSFELALANVQGMTSASVETMTPSGRPRRKSLRQASSISSLRAHPT